MVNTQSTAAIASQTGNPTSRERSRLAHPLLLLGKVAVSAVCFWLVLRQINARETIRILTTFDYRWTALGVLLIMAQIPLLALRLWSIVRGISRGAARLTYGAANAVSAMYGLLAQVLPNIFGEGIRAWMLVRLGCGWRESLTSVALDRGVGLVMLLVFSVAILLLPSPLSSLLGYRELVLLIFGGALVVGVAGLLAAPRLGPFLQRWRYTQWAGDITRDAHRVLLGIQAFKIFGASALIHVITILAIWCIGRSEGLLLSMNDCAVLFVIMLGVALIPISLGGWGLRELAVVSLLSAHGLAPDRALLFSVHFGCVLLLSGLPGIAVWPLYPLRPSHAAMT